MDRNDTRTTGQPRLVDAPTEPAAAPEAVEHGPASLSQSHPAACGFDMSNRRAAMGAALIEILGADFEAHGEETISKVREDRPVDYLKLVAAIGDIEKHLGDGNLINLLAYIEAGRHGGEA